MAICLHCGAEKALMRSPSVSSQLKSLQMKGNDEKAIPMDGIVDALQRISSSEEARDSCRAKQFDDKSTHVDCYR